MKHFRLAKGWKKELEEISLVVVMVVVVVTLVCGNAVAATTTRVPAAKNSVPAAPSMTAAFLRIGVNIAFKGASALFFKGHVMSILAVCTGGLSNPCIPFENLQAPYVILDVDENPPIIGVTPSAAMPGCVPAPAPGFGIIGFGIPGLVHKAFLYCAMPAVSG